MNLANKLTVSRIILIPVFMFFLLSGYNYIAVGIFIIASLTDALDGYVARSRNLVTSFGKFLDPLADKLLVTAALVCMVEVDMVPSWIVVVILSREFTISLLRAVAATEGKVIAASKWGKVKTISQMIAIIVILFNDFHFNLLNIPFGQIVLWIALAMTIISGVDYLVKNKEILLESK